MAGVAFTLELNDAAVMAGLGAMKAWSLDLRPTMDRIGMVLEASTIDRFDRGVGPDGVAWPDSHRVLLSGGKTLVLSGRLRGSITHNAYADSVEIGSNLVYAAVHQTGFDGVVTVSAHDRAFKMVFGKPYSGTAHVRSHQRKSNTPARPYLGLSADDRLDVIEEISDAWGGAIQRGAQ